MEGKTTGKLVERLRLRLVDASCATCVVPVRRALERVIGIEWVSANPVLELIFVDYDPRLTGADHIISEVKKTGYTAVRTTN